MTGVRITHHDSDHSWRVSTRTGVGIFQPVCDEHGHPIDLADGIEDGPEARQFRSVQQALDHFCRVGRILRDMPFINDTARPSAKADYVIPEENWRAAQQHAQRIEREIQRHMADAMVYGFSHYGFDRGRE